MSFSGRSQMPASIYKEESEEKNPTLTQLRSELAALKSENKALARQLHIDRYVSKTEAQQDMQNLTNENSRLSIENVAMKETLRAGTQQVAATERILEVRNKETKALIVQLEELEKKLQGRGNESGKIDEAIKVLEASSNKKRCEIENLLQKYEETVASRDEEVALAEELNEIIEKTSIDMENLHKRKDYQATELAKNEAYAAELKREIDSVKSSMNSLKGILKENDEEILTLKENVKGREHTLRNLHEKLAADKLKHSTLLTMVQDKPTTTTAIQTEAFTDEGSLSTLGKQGSRYHRGSVVRLCGAGGNMKHKFGKNLEIRATNYSRHVQLNVKFNK